MSIETSVYARLAPLVGGECYPLAAPPEAKAPYLVFTVLGAYPGLTFAGIEDGAPVQVQVDAWDVKHTGAIAAANAAFNEMTRDDGAGFGCAGVQRLPDDHDPETGRYAQRWEYTLHPQE